MTRDSSAIPAAGREQAAPPPLKPVGVRIAGTSRAVPEKRLTNFDLEKMMDTSDEWIFQRTGIRERRICDHEKGENVISLCTEALTKALADARMAPTELDQLILGTVTGETVCPSTSCRVAANVGAIGAAAFDISAACSGFVFGLNIASDMIRAGSCRTCAVIGCEVMSNILDYSDRGVSILFGDAAGCAILRATDDTTKGPIASVMHADGRRWGDLYLPHKPRDVPPGVDASKIKMHKLQMNGREVYKFAVGTFTELIFETLEKAGLAPDDIDMYICHQSNARMLESARERLGIPGEKMYMNIERYGNCSSGSVPVCLSELREQGKCRDGDLVMFVAFGAGMTWGASVWRM